MSTKIPDDLERTIEKRLKTGKKMNMKAKVRAAEKLLEKGTGPNAIRKRVAERMAVKATLKEKRDEERIKKKFLSKPLPKTRNSCGPNFERLSKNERKRFDEALDQNNDKARALRTEMQETTKGDYCLPNREGYSDLLQQALEETISKIPKLYSNFDKDLGKLNSEEKRKLAKSLQQTKAEFLGNIRKTKAVQLEERAKSRGVWANLTGALSNYFGWKAKQDCKNHGLCPTRAEAAFVDRVTTPPDPARTKDDALGRRVKKRMERFSPVKQRQAGSSSGAKWFLNLEKKRVEGYLGPYFEIDREPLTLIQDNLCKKLAELTSRFKVDVTSYNYYEVYEKEVIDAAGKVLVQEFDFGLEKMD